MSGRTELAELARLFLRLGLTAFGGPAAHIALMEDEVVRRRNWLSREEFLDLLGAANLIPGPNSTELAIHIGRRRAGWAGLLVAGVCFILPAALATTALAWGYLRFGTLPRVGSVLAGVKAVMIAVVAQALWSLGRTAIRSRWLAALAAAAAVAGFLGGHELAILLVAGAVPAVIRVVRGGGESGPGTGTGTIGGRGSGNGGGGSGAAALVPWPLLMVGGGAAPGLVSLFLTFAKIGSVLFGSGYVLLAFLRADLVERTHWLTEQQLLDAVAAGQITPGPLFSTATFAGYLISGGAGAAVATLGIFAPAFLFVAISGPLIPWMRRTPAAGAFLDGVNAASLALMAVVTWQLGRAAVVGIPTAAIALVSAVLLVRWKVNTLWLVLGGALVGLFLL
jgi:chromate transporter